MREAERQYYLKAMGLTPWVACEPLPGAAPSPVLDWAEEVEGTVTQVAEAVPVSAAPRPSNEPQAPRRDKTTPVSSLSPTTAEAGVVFTLEAHLAGETWVVFQQEDAQAPGLGRHAGALAASVLAVFGAGPARPRRFHCPLTGQPMSHEQAGQALHAFFSGLARGNGGTRVLLCLEEELAATVLGGGRYQPLTLGDLPTLVISTLAEMLADPARHKGESWRAMREHGFDGGDGPRAGR